MLIEASTSATAGEVTGIFDGTAELHLFHYKCGSDECGVEAAEYGKKPLYVKTADRAQRGVLLHRVQAERFPEPQAQ